MADDEFYAANFCMLKPSNILLLSLRNQSALTQAALNAFKTTEKQRFNTNKAWMPQMMVRCTTPLFFSHFQNSTPFFAPVPSAIVLVLTVVVES